jgi:quercetin dioxygenase-like cupin family protein
MEKKEFDTSTAFRFDDLVQYTTDSIVSRTILNKATGTVTLFAFYKGQGLSEHTAPFDALVQIADGKAIIVIDRMDYPLSKGESIIMPANITHAVRAVENFKMILTMIKSA